VSLPQIHVETVGNPLRYSFAQIERACRIAQALNRGRFVLAERPSR
jgi:hypothetical protein